MQQRFKIDLRYPFIFLASIALVSCGGSGSDAQAWESAVAASNKGFRNTTTIASVSIPVLKSKTLEAKWGKPSLEVNNSGGYRLSYSDPNTPFNRLVVYGSTKALPELITPPMASFYEMVDGELETVKRKQLWRVTMVGGKKVMFYQESGPSGADGAYYSTEGFSLTDRSGETGYYRLVVEGGESESVVSQRFSSVGF